MSCTREFRKSSFCEVCEDNDAACATGRERDEVDPSSTEVVGIGLRCTVRAATAPEDSSAEGVGRLPAVATGSSADGTDAVPGCGCGCGEAKERSLGSRCSLGATLLTGESSSCW